MSSLDLMDKSGEYRAIGRYAAGEGKHYNTIFQFENQAIECDDCLGTEKADQIEMLVHFLEPVDFGTKNDLECLATLRMGYAGEYRAPVHLDEDVTPCVSWVQKFFN